MSVRAAHPLDDVLARVEPVRVDLEPDALRREPEPEQAAAYASGSSTGLSRTNPPSGPANAGSRATSRATACDGCASFAGTWIAS